MRMKDVIAKTGLTDRAVRLYIENGLVAPDFGETDSGRRSLDFSEADVDSLKKIATLRKAGFSIAEIKEMKNNEDCKETVLTFIENTISRIETDTLIVNSLQNLVEKDEITLDTVCRSLDAPTAEKSVPAEDLKIPKEEVFKRKIFLVSGIAGIVIWILLIVLRISINEQEYRFCEIRNYGVFLFRLTVNILFLLSSILLILLNFRTKRYKKEKHKQFFKTTTVSIVLFSVLLLTSFTDFDNLALSLIYPDFYSLTTDAENYLELDKAVKSYSDNIYSVFPASIPARGYLENCSYEDDITYYYQYSRDTDIQLDIEAEFKLKDESYEDYKLKAFSSNQDITGTKQKGDWTCLYFKDSHEEAAQKYFYLIFAYNDNTKQVRYIAACYEFGSAAVRPHYHNLKW